VTGRHVALIVEDDPQIADILEELVTSLGHDCRRATTLEEVRAAVATGGYCYVLLDMQIPADARSRASVGCGETALRLLRRAAPARSTHDGHVLPILVVTSYSREPDFVTKTIKEGADDFIPKPFGERIDRVLDKIRDALARADREEHAACTANTLVGPFPPTTAPLTTPVTPVSAERPASAETSAATVRLAIDGTYRAQRNDVIVNGVRGSVTDAQFLVLLNAIGVHLRAPGEWESAAKLGMARSNWAPSRIVSELKDLLPKGFRVIEANKPHNFRLNPAIVIERVDWGALAKHPLPAVRKIAAEWGKG
jgi:DNA-binding response OmpR family regulator